MPRLLKPIAVQGGRGVENIQDVLLTLFPLIFGIDINVRLDKGKPSVVLLGACILLFVKVPG